MKRYGLHVHQQKRIDSETMIITTTPEMKRWPRLIKTNTQAESQPTKTK